MMEKRLEKSSLFLWSCHEKYDKLWVKKSDYISCKTKCYSFVTMKIQFCEI